MNIKSNKVVSTILASLLMCSFTYFKSNNIAEATDVGVTPLKETRNVTVTIESAFSNTPVDLELTLDKQEIKVNTGVVIPGVEFDDNVGIHVRSTADYCLMIYNKGIVNSESTVIPDIILEGSINKLGYSGSKSFVKIKQLAGADTTNSVSLLNSVAGEHDYTLDLRLGTGSKISKDDIYTTNLIVEATQRGLSSDGLVDIQN